MTLSVVGIGYGGGLTEVASEAIASADVVIGHESFIRAVQGVLTPAVQAFDVVDLASPEEDVFAVRARIAAERAAGGADVVILSGGDPGLLGMAGPLLDKLNAAARLSDFRVRVIPGLSAWQYASARLGAPFNSGVSVISLCLYSHTEQRVKQQVDAVLASGLGVVAYMLRHNGEYFPELFPTDENPGVIARRRFLSLCEGVGRQRGLRTPIFLMTDLGGEDEAVRSILPSQAADCWTQVTSETLLCVPAEDAMVVGEFVWTVS